MRVFLLITLFAFYARAEKIDKNLPGLIVAGDSWAYLPCFFDSVHRAFGENLINVNIVGCLETSQAGARAENYKNSKAYFEVIDLLKKHKHIKAIHLSLGGNDMFRGWNKNMSKKSETELFIKIKNHILEICNDFLKINAHLKILVNGYDYGYQYDNNPVKPYREIYENMGKPTAEEVNSGFLRFTQTMLTIKTENIYYIHHHGLMHYHYGIPDAAIEHNKTLPPAQISSMQNPENYGGVIYFKNAPEAMARIFNMYIDPHHLSPEGYDFLIKHNIENYFKYWL